MSAHDSARRVLILGANGPSGRTTVRQALDRGLSVTAVTRNPQAFPIKDDRLIVVAGDATQKQTIEQAINGCDAVISVIGTAYTWKPVEVYSSSVRLVIDAMQRQGQRRLIVVTSGATPRKEEHGPLLERALKKVWRMTYTRTLYDDMVKMETMVTSSGLDWTIVRPPALSADPGAGYDIKDTYNPAAVMARDDLGAMLLDQLDDTNWLRRIAAVASPRMKFELVKTIRKEILKR